MPTRYFMKELPTMPLFVMGYPLRFDFLETEDGALIAELDNAIRNRVGGVSSITKEQYDSESQKKTHETLSANNSNPAQWRKELVAPHFQEQNVAARGSFAKPQQPPAVSPQVLNPQPHEMPDALSVPSPESLKIPRPPTAKLNKPAP